LNIAKITAISTQRGINHPDAPLIFGVEDINGGFRPIKVPDHELVRFLNAREETALSKNNPAKPVRRIALDFDGTLCDHAFPGIGEIKPGVKDAVERLRSLGFYILIWSCRTSHWDYNIFGGNPSQPALERERVKEMIAWLDANEIPYDEIDDGSRGKPLADFYVDDRAIRFDSSTNWFTIASAIERAEIERNK
jgi:hypothetical protein